MMTNARKMKPVFSLFKYNWFMLKNYSLVYCGLAIFVGLIAVAIGATSLYPLFAVLVCGAMSIPACLEQDKSAWAKYRLTLPVKRSHTVLANFLTYSIYLIIGMVLTAFFTAIAFILDSLSLLEMGRFLLLPLDYLLGVDRGYLVDSGQLGHFGTISATINFSLIALTTCFLNGSLYFPFSRIVPKSMEYVFSFLTLFAAAGLLILMNWLSGLLGLDRENLAIGLVVNLLIPFAIFLSSYFLTVRLNAKKDVMVS